MVHRSHSHALPKVASCDEALLDMTGTTDPLSMARRIRADILDVTGCPASIGIGSNILLARLATRGITPWRDMAERISYMFTFGACRGQAERPTPSARCSGATSAGRSAGSRSTRSRMGDWKAACCPRSNDVWYATACTRGRALSHELPLIARGVGDVIRRSKAWLQSLLGPKKGEQLWNFAHGRDDRKLKFNPQRKSIGTDVNWGIRFTEEAEVKEFLGRLSKELSERLATANQQYVP